MVEGRRHHGSRPDAEIDFSTNVNPETPEGVERVYGDALRAARRYPTDGTYYGFREAAAEHVGCRPGSVVPTAGALAGLRLCLTTLVDEGDSVAVPRPGFSEYGREVSLRGAEPTPVPHSRMTDIDPREYDAAIVCNPNNPTGDAYPTEELTDLASACATSDTTLLVDEAFLGFTRRGSAAGAEGAVVLRSLTKLFGLPGLRAGFVVARGDALDALRRARLEWNLGVPAARVGEHCLRRRGFVERTVDRVEAERDRMTARVRSMEGILSVDEYRSVAPFFLIEPEPPVGRVLGRLADAGIAVRDATTFDGLENHIRVSVRTRQENERLLEALGDLSRRS